MIDPEAELPGTQEVVNRQNELKDVLEAIRKDLNENHKRTQALKAEAEQKAAQGEPFEKPAELAAVEKQQRDLADRLEQLALRFGGHRLFVNLTPETQRIAREPLSQAADILQKTAGQAEANEKAQTLESSGNSLAAAETDLEKLARRFDELADLERALLVVPRLAKQADRVAEQALELAKQRENPPLDETPEQKAAREAKLGEDQATVEAERQQLADALDDLLDHRPEVLAAARKTALEEIAELSKKASALADRQDVLTDALKADANKAAKEAAPIAEHQAKLVEKADELKPPETNPKPTNQPPQAKPIDPEELREVLENLKAGNLDAAEKQQEAIADRLETLAAELKKNAELPKDSQKAAEQLAARERALQKRIAEAAKRQPAKNADPAERKAFEDEVRKLAEAQTGLQAGIAELDVPPLQRKQQQKAVDGAASAVRDLIQNDPGKAAKAAEQTAQALEQLAKNIGTPKDRQAQAEALEALQKAAQAKEELETLQKNRKQEPPKNPPKPEDDEELQRLIQKNEEAKRKAAEALERLKQQLKNQPEEKLDDELRNLDQLVQKPPTAGPSNDNPSAEQVEQLAREARAVKQEIEQLKKKQAEEEHKQVAQAENPAQPAAEKPAESPAPRPEENNPPANGQQSNDQRPKNPSPNESGPKNPQANLSDPNGSKPNPLGPNGSKPNPSDPNNSSKNPSDTKASRPNQSPAPEPQEGQNPNQERDPNANGKSPAPGSPAQPKPEQPPGNAAGENDRARILSALSNRRNKPPRRGRV